MFSIYDYDHFVLKYIDNVIIPNLKYYDNRKTHQKFMDIFKKKYMLSICG
jgi:hypothetical protein